MNEEVYDCTSKGRQRIYNMYKGDTKFLCPICKSPLIIALDNESAAKYGVHTGIYCPTDIKHVCEIIELQSSRKRFREWMENLDQDSETD